MAMVIEERFAVAHEGHATPGENPLSCWRCDDNRNIARAVLEEAWQAAHNEYGYVSEEEFAVALKTVSTRIALLRADPTRQELIAEHEMVQAQTPVVNEDGER